MTLEQWKVMKRIIIAFASILTVITTNVHLSLANSIDITPFVAPSILNTKQELSNLSRLQNFESPKAMKALKLLTSSHYSDLDREFHAYETVKVAARESTPEEQQFKEDAPAARSLALMWHITGEDAYRVKSSNILTEWSKTFKNLKVAKGHKSQAYLEAAWTLPVWVSAADMLRYGDTRWMEAERESFKKFIVKLNAYAKKAHRDNNWGASATLAGISASVYLKDRKSYQKNIKYFKHYLKTLSNSDGSMNSDYLSDSWHSQYAIISLIHSAEIASHQGTDLYGFIIEGERLPRLAEILEHFAGLFIGKIPNPEGLKRGNYRGAHNNKQAYQIAYKYLKLNRPDVLENMPNFIEMMESWSPTETSIQFMKWDRVTHSILEQDNSHDSVSGLH